MTDEEIRRLLRHAQWNAKPVFEARDAWDAIAHVIREMRDDIAELRETLDKVADIGERMAKEPEPQWQQFGPAAIRWARTALANTQEWKANLLPASVEGKSPP